MPTGILVLNFGEPDEPSLERAEPYLERIFLQNAGLEGHADEAARVRARQLARERAPGLVEAYRAIGGSPLNAQAEAQARALEAELSTRSPGHRVYAAFQFTDPSVRDGVARARRDGMDALVALPVYPMCGHSTTVAALREVRRALDELDWAPRFVGLGGWHALDGYAHLRAEHVRLWVAERGLDLRDPDTLLYFSVHGTPIRYLAEGRYDRYVLEHCRDVARRLGADRWRVGFQNHANRRIRWTQPDNEDAIRAVEEGRVVVVPIAFMHEQSETLAELDGELRAFVEGLGKELHRVPVPHGDPAFPALLADLVVRAASDDPGADGVLSACRCCPMEGCWCTNGGRELPPSPYGPAREEVERG